MATGAHASFIPAITRLDEQGDTEQPRRVRTGMASAHSRVRGRAWIRKIGVIWTP